MIVRHLIVPLTVAALVAGAVDAMAQGAFPAPLPNQQPANASPFPPVNGAGPAASFGQPSAFPSQGAAPLAGGAGPSFGPPQGAGGPSEACLKAFVPLRSEAEKRGLALKAAGERHAGAEEICKLIKLYSQSELKMLTYIEHNAAKCGIPPQISEQQKKSHAGTEQTLKRVCDVAAAQQRGPAGPSLSEVLGSAAVLPEPTATKKGGSTFDTLNGNVLAR